MSQYTQLYTGMTNWITSLLAVSNTVSNHTKILSLSFLLPPTLFLSVSVEPSSLHTVRVQSAYNNIVPLPPTQTHPLCAPRSPRLPCVATAPAVTRTLAQRPGNRAVMPVAAVSNENAYWPVKMISESWGSKKTWEKSAQNLWKQTALVWIEEKTTSFTL